jgi:hypothetical protein
VSVATLDNQIVIVRHVQRVSHYISAVAEGIFDPESGIQQMYVAIGNASNLEALREFRPTAPTMLLTGLALPEGEISVTVRAVNRADAYSDVSLPVGVDTTPPPEFSIALNGNRPNQPIQYTMNVTGIVVEWIALDAPPWEHVPVNCEWAVGSYPEGEDEQPWAPTSSQGTLWWSSLPAYLQNGVVYFVSVRCRDQVGWSTTTVSGGLMPDLVRNCSYAPPCMFRAQSLSAFRRWRLTWRSRPWWSTQLRDRRCATLAAST